VKRETLISLYRTLADQQHYREYKSENLALLRFDGAPFDGAIGLFTIGMSSRTQPGQSASGAKRKLRTELFMAVREEFFNDAFDLMIAVSKYPFAARTQVHWRHSIPLGNPCRQGGITGLLLTFPPFKANEMTIQERDERVDLLWIIPLVGGEFDYVRSSGVDAFEQRLENAGADILDLERVAVV